MKTLLDGTKSYTWIIGSAPDLVSRSQNLYTWYFKMNWIADCFIESCFCRQEVLRVFSQYSHSVSNHEKSNLTLSSLMKFCMCKPLQRCYNSKFKTCEFNYSCFIDIWSYKKIPFNGMTCSFLLVITLALVVMWTASVNLTGQYLIQETNFTFVPDVQYRGGCAFI